MDIHLNFLISVVCVVMFIIMNQPQKADADEDIGTNFFLKASKSVPRIGRRSEYDNFFLKASKSVPRIGRRRTIPASGEAQVPYYLLTKVPATAPSPDKKADKLYTDPAILYIIVVEDNQNKTEQNNYILLATVHKFSAVNACTSMHLTSMQAGHPAWSLDKAYEEYPELLQSDEPYIVSNPDYFWQRMKRNALS